MAKLDAARKLLDSRWNKFIGGLFGRASEITLAVEALAREVARDEFAKLSPAPVGDAMMPTPEELASGISIRKIEAADFYAPTPPAEGSDGGEAGAALRYLKMLAEEAVEESIPVHCSGSTVLEAIADLEARLAKSEDHAAYMDAQCAAKSERAESAESALTDARKRIGELEAGLRSVRTDVVLLVEEAEDYGPAVAEIDALLTAPASPETPEGQEKADG